MFGISVGRQPWKTFSHTLSHGQGLNKGRTLGVFCYCEWHTWETSSPYQRPRFPHRSAVSYSQNKRNCGSTCRFAFKGPHGNGCLSAICFWSGQQHRAREQLLKKASEHGPAHPWFRAALCPSPRSELHQSHVTHPQSSAQKWHQPWVTAPQAWI